MALRRRKKESEYHTGRLNISCPPSMKDRIAADATAQGKSISQYIMGLYEKSHEAGSSEHLARVGLEMLGLKKRMVDLEARMRRSITRSQGAIDANVAADLAKLRELEGEIDIALKETIEAVKLLKDQGK